MGSAFYPIYNQSRPRDDPRLRFFFEKPALLSNGKRGITQHNQHGHGHVTMGAKVFFDRLGRFDNLVFDGVGRYSQLLGYFLVGKSFLSTHSEDQLDRKSVV